jgi:CubicO group peptidase (beta-lactamase class C family)
MLKTLAVCAAVWCAAVAAAAQPLSPLPPQPVDTPWPTQAWPTAPLPVSANRDRLAQVIAQAMPARHPDMGETRALLVVQGGRLVVERYAEGFGADTRFISWSMAKSITHGLVGVGVAQGLLNPDAGMGNPRWHSEDPRSAITWRQWLQMRDGLAYQEVAATGFASSGAAQMLFGDSRRDPIAYATSLPLIHQPGTHWNYSTAGINLVADALTTRVAPGAPPRERRAAMMQFMRRGLFDPIGMRSVQPEFDAQGGFLGGAYIWATAQDYARFGYLYLRGGVWDGRRILPVGWVDFARTAPPGSDADMYGAGFYITPVTGTGSPQRALIVGRNPPDGFSMQGRDGQVVLIVPSQDLIIVRLGNLTESPRRWEVLGDWLAAIAQCFPTPAQISIDAAPPQP